MPEVLSTAAYIIAAASLFMAGRASKRPRRMPFDISNESPIELEFMMDDETNTLHIRATRP
jgi:hypothetical protein